MAHNSMDEHSCPCGIPCKFLQDCQRVYARKKELIENGKITLHFEERSMYQRILLKAFGYKEDTQNPKNLTLTLEDNYIKREIFKENQKCPVL